MAEDLPTDERAAKQKEPLMDVGAALIAQGEAMEAVEPGQRVIAHAFSPIDLMPDFMAIPGYFNDLVQRSGSRIWFNDLVLALLEIALAVRMIPTAVMAECREGARNGPRGSRPVKTGWRRALSSRFGSPWAFWAWWWSFTYCREAGLGRSGPPAWRDATIRRMETHCAERIILIGPPGGGKTTVGAAVAALLGWSFMDTDALVERAAGRSIPEIFASEGEPLFRE